MKQLSVIIPAYNEEKVIFKNLKQVESYLKRNFDKHEIIVVNDGSSDKTADEVRKFGKAKLVTYKKNRGKGYAVKKGVFRAKYEHVLFMDADLATPVSEIKRFVPYADDFDVVIASRMLPDSEIKLKQPFIRTLLGTTGKKIVKFFLLGDINDSQCGFKLFKRDVARRLFGGLTIERWGFDFEILHSANKLSLKIKEVPVIWYSMEDSKLKMTDYITTLIDLIKLRLRLLFRKY